MNTLEKEFVPYEQALELKELGFDEPCFMQWTYAPDLIPCVCNWGKLKPKTNQEAYSDSHGDCISAPTFSQAFRWFREKYDLDIDISRNDQEMIDYVKSKGVTDLKKYRCGYSDGTSHAIKGCYSYEEAELGCLIKLIEIVKNK